MNNPKTPGNTDNEKTHTLQQMLQANLLRQQELSREQALKAADLARLQDEIEALKKLQSGKIRRF